MLLWLTVEMAVDRHEAKELIQQTTLAAQKAQRGNSGFVLKTKHE